MKALRYLDKYLLKYKYSLLLGTLCILLKNAFSAGQAPIVREAIDLVDNALRENPVLSEAQKSDYALKVLGFIGLLLGLALVSGFFLYLHRKIIIGVSRWIEFDLKNEIYQHYQSLPLQFYRKNNTGDIMNRISEDVNQVRNYLGPAFMYILNLILMFIIYVPLMLSVSPTLTLYTLIPLPILAISIFVVNNVITRQSESIQKSLSGLSTFVQEAFSGIRVIKSFIREKDSADRFTMESNNYRKQSLGLAKVNALFFPLILGLVGLSIIMIIWIGGIEVQNKNITYGNLVEFLIYLSALSWPVASLGWTSSLIMRAEASQKRINEFLKTKNDIVSDKNIQQDIEGNIVFKNITFAYPDSGIVALKNVNFEIPAGQTLAIIGNTGSGKSTIANLLLRLYDPKEGSISINNTPLKSLDIQHYRSHIGYVPQDVFLFSDSIRNNIAFGYDNLSNEKIVKAAVDADLYHNILDFPAQFDTIIGERGITLSGGQKQRLSIARALVRNPQLLILDDCLSAVDTKTEHNILENLKEIMYGRTSVIISHRVSSVKLANKIIVLEHGSIVEEGTHEELLQRNGHYKELYVRQLKEEETLS